MVGETGDYVLVDRDVARVYKHLTVTIGQGLRDKDRDRERLITR